MVSPSPDTDEVASWKESGGVGGRFEWACIIRTNNWVSRGLKMNKLINMLRDESGASAAEYALILAIIGAAIAFAAIALSDAIANAMNDAAECIESDGTNCA